MAKRRFLDNRPLTDEQGLTALIVMGVGLTTGAIFTTCFLALSSSPAAMWHELWLSGQLNFGASAAIAQKAVVDGLVDAKAGAREWLVPGGGLMGEGWLIDANDH